jgi:hypothetical protein
MVPAAFTRSLWRATVSVWAVDGGGSTILVMDVVSVLLALVMFAVLYVLILGIDRV